MSERNSRKKQYIIYMLCALSMMLVVYGMRTDKWKGEDFYAKAAQTEVDVWDGTADTSWYDGTTTQGKHWSISTPEQLAGVGKLMAEGVDFDDQTIELVNDIYLNEDWEKYANWGSEPPANEWEPISGNLNGIFDGGNYVIYGLYINNQENYQGLFGNIVADSGSITNVSLEDSYVKGKNYVGGIVGNTNRSLDYCEFAGCVYGDDYVGGIVGNTNQSLDYCEFAGCVYGDDYVGGIAGKCPIITQCCNRGKVTGVTNVGGVVGEIGEQNGRVENVCNQGSVSGTAVVGGLIGKAVSTSCSVVHVYVSGTVSGQEATGILIGKSNISDWGFLNVYMVRNEEINYGLQDVGCNAENVKYTEDVSNVEVVSKEYVTTSEFFEKLRGDWMHIWVMEIGIDEGPIPLYSQESEKRLMRVEYYIETDDIAKIVYVNCGKQLKEADAPEVPEKTGYVFREWEWEYSDNVWNYKDSIPYLSEEVMKLYARYEKVSASKDNTEENQGGQSSEITPEEEESKESQQEVKEEEQDETPKVQEDNEEKPKEETSQSSAKTVAKKKKLTAPTFTLKKKKTKSGKRYIQIKIKKYKGKYVEIRTAMQKGKKKTKFYKIKLKNSNIKKNKKVFNIKYKKQKGTFIFQLRTYKKQGKKKVYSYYSKTKRIRLT